MANWNHDSRKAFRLALQRVYPSYEALALFVSESIDENLANIAGDKRLDLAVHALLQWALTKPGKLDELFEAFCAENPNSSDIPGIRNAIASLSDKPHSVAFIDRVREALVQQKLVHDLSQNSEFFDFSFIAYKETLSSLDFVALVAADCLNERQIVDLRNRFFEAVQTVSYDFGLRPLARNPNGLLIFVFEQECPHALPSFIQKQSRAESFNKSAVVVSWAIDTQNQTAYTHNNPVTIMPPIWILKQTVFPGLDFLNQCFSEDG
ncbi:MAG: effector-associated domain EAD1-containing protein [Phormidesmis sp.]